MRKMKNPIEWIRRPSERQIRRSRFGILALVLFALAVFAAGAVGLMPAEAHVQTKINSKDGLTYVWIPPGTFQMGCSPDDSLCGAAEKPAHKVTITRGFWIGQTPVTQAAWKKVEGSNPSRQVGDRLPVESVNWQQAESFCKKSDMRLPTEAEYEYAARGGTTGPRYGALDRIAWYLMNSKERTHQVAQKQPNAYGLYDTLGNVWEWVADWYGPYDRASAVDPQGAASRQFRVLRGGSFGGPPAFVRASFRNWFVPSARYNDLGFRCARN